MRTIKPHTRKSALQKTKEVTVRESPTCQQRNAQLRQFFGHLSFEVADIHKTREFFDILLGELGFRRKFTMEDALCYSNSQVDIWFAKEQVQRVTRSNPSAEQDVVAEHTAIMVSNREKVKAVENTMRAKGFKVLFPAQEFEEGYFSVSFVAPDNIVFEVFTKPM